MNSRNTITAASHRRLSSRRAPSRPATILARTIRASRLVLALGTALCASSASAQTAPAWELVDDLAPAAVARAITADSAGNIFVAGNTRDSANRPTAVVMKSSNGGLTWDNDPSTPDVDESSDALSTTDGSLAVFDAIAARRVTTPAGTLEDQVVSSGRAGRVYGGPSDPLTGTLTSPWLIRRTRNAGATWETLDQFVHPAYHQLPGYARPYGIAMDQSGTIYVAGCARESIPTTKGKTVTYTYVNHWIVRKGIPGADGSFRWTTFDFAFPVSSETDREGTVFPSAVACIGNRVFIVGGGGNYWHVLQTSNGGTTWSVADNFRFATSGNSHAFAIAADSQGNLYVVGSGERVTTTGSGRNVTTVLERVWLVRKGLPDGTNWSTTEQIQVPGGLASATGVTVGLNNDVYVTGSIQSASSNAHWITRQRSAVTGLWSQADDFVYAAANSSQGGRITTDPFGNLFATGSGTDASGVAHNWLVRRKLFP